MNKIDHNKLRAAIRAEMEAATGEAGGELSAARTRLKGAYLGEPLPNDAERGEAGWSGYQDRTVLETVEWAKPSLLRVFASTDEIVRFEPSRPEQEQNAADATDYINQVVFGGGAFGMIHDVITDALMQRVAWAKVSLERAESRGAVREYSGLSHEEAKALLLRSGVENAEVEREAGGRGADSYRVTVRSDGTGPEQRIRVMALPSERVLWNADALDMESCRFVAHWEDRSLADLRAEGHDPALLDEIQEDKGTWPEADLQAFATTGKGADDLTERSGRMRRVRVYEAYILMPEETPGFSVWPRQAAVLLRGQDERGTPSSQNLAFLAKRKTSAFPQAVGSMGPHRKCGPAVSPAEGDGCERGFTPREATSPTASARQDGGPSGILNGEQRWKVVFAGQEAQTILSAKVWPLPRPPLFPVSSVPLPHQVGGLCLSDLVRDLQNLRTELFRQLLDSLALSNQGEFVVKRQTINDFVDMDQFGARRIGGVYSITGNADIVPLPTDSRAATEAAGALKLTDTLKETRTGVGQQVQGLQADALQNTATGAVIMEDSANQRLELIARILGEMFFKPVAKYALLLASRYQNKPVQARLRGRFFEWKPTEWDPDMDVSVAVGLGTGNRSRKAAAMTQIVALQEKILGLFGPASPVRAPQLYAACSHFIGALGQESPEKFLGAEEDWARAEQALMAAQAASGGRNSPDAQKMKLEEQKLRLEQQKAQADMALQQAKAQAEMALQQARARAGMDLERERAQADMALQARKMDAEQQIAAMKLQGEMALDRAGMELKGRTEPGSTELRKP